MAEQEQIRKSPARDAAKTEADEDLATEQAPATSERGEKIKAELDDLLDEIDEVLEDNAEEFVRNYVQKGGQ
jgi:prokaryotic ubiquitin-like protein Pup